MRHPGESILHFRGTNFIIVFYFRRIPQYRRRDVSFCWNHTLMPFMHIQTRCAKWHASFQPVPPMLKVSQFLVSWRRQNQFTVLTAMLERQSFRESFGPLPLMANVQQRHYVTKLGFLSYLTSQEALHAISLSSLPKTATELALCVLALKLEYCLMMMIETNTCTRNAAALRLCPFFSLGKLYMFLKHQ